MSAGALAGISNQPSVQTNAYSDLSSSEFVKILLSELSNQDPLDPQDSKALLEQLSLIRDIESSQTLQASVESLVLQNGVSSASGLIGQRVTGLDSSNREVSGVVRSLRVESGAAVLVLDGGVRLPAERVTAVVPQDTSGDADLARVVRDLALLQPGAVLGRLAQGLDASGKRIEGVVTAVRVEDDEVVLELDGGQSLPVSSLERISAAEAG